MCQYEQQHRLSHGTILHDAAIVISLSVSTKDIFVAGVVDNRLFPTCSSVTSKKHSLL